MVQNLVKYSFLNSAATQNQKDLQELSDELNTIHQLIVKNDELIIRLIKAEGTVDEQRRLDSIEDLKNRNELLQNSSRKLEINKARLEIQIALEPQVIGPTL